MQWSCIGFPIQFPQNARSIFAGDHWSTAQSAAIERRFLFSITPERLRNCLRHLPSVLTSARVELKGALKVSHGLFPAPLTPLDKTHHWEYPRDYWASSGEQLPVQPERHHSRGIRYKDAVLVRGVLRRQFGRMRNASWTAASAAANRAGVWSKPKK